VSRPCGGPLFSLLGAVLAGAGVAAGAFGAHALKAVLAPDMQAVFETAVRYQMYHALALVLVGAASGWGAPAAKPWLGRSGWCFAAGIGLFSGSLYGMALAGWRWLGPVTPLGGLAFILGWGCLAAAALKCMKAEA
jgi:uncharacterized membrane protein YgdD (TMEM256/DUF423 family)